MMLHSHHRFYCALRNEWSSSSSPGCRVFTASEKCVKHWTQENLTTRSQEPWMNTQWNDIRCALSNWKDDGISGTHNSVMHMNSTILSHRVFNYPVTRCTHVPNTHPLGGNVLMRKMCICAKGENALGPFIRIRLFCSRSTVNTCIRRNFVVWWRFDFR